MKRSELVATKEIYSLGNNKESVEKTFTLVSVEGEVVGVEIYDGWDRVKLLEPKDVRKMAQILEYMP